VLFQNPILLSVRIVFVQQNARQSESHEVISPLLHLGEPAVLPFFVLSNYLALHLHEVQEKAAKLRPLII
jgi:hypothetical protein